MSAGTKDLLIFGLIFLVVMGVSIKLAFIAAKNAGPDDMGPG